MTDRGLTALLLALANTPAVPNAIRAASGSGGLVYVTNAEPVVV